LKHKVLSYPKNVTFKEEVIEITVDSKNNNTFF